MPTDKGDVPIESTDGNAELESQFILRLPPLPAAALKSVVASGVLGLKERLFIQLDADMRNGTVAFDGWQLNAKVVDLPSIIESLKTLDDKTFYKTADICQLVICKEGAPEEDKPEGEEAKKKDGKDKKFLYPHGITPPLKNARKKRFRKTLKKKFFDVPEIEKEVKRLFRTDSEAIFVRYEVETKDEKSKEGAKQGAQVAGPSGIISNNSQSMDIVEHDLFGEVLSSSDEEDTRAQDTDNDEGSRLSSPPMREASSSQKDTSTVSENKYVTEFTPGMLTDHDNRGNSGNTSFDITSESSSAAAAAAVAALEEANEMGDVDVNSSANDDLINRLNDLQNEIAAIREKRQIQEAEIAGIDNAALVSRFMVIIDEFKRQEAEKRQQYQEILMVLNQQI